MAAMVFFDNMRILCAILFFKGIIGGVNETKEDFSNGWSEKIEWMSYEEGLTIAAELHRPMMVVIHSTNCGACEELKEKFASSEQLEYLSQDLVMVNILKDTSPLLSQKLAPDGDYAPRVLFIAPTGRIMVEIANQSRNISMKYLYTDMADVVFSIYAAMENMDESSYHYRKDQHRDEL